jgi:predicted HicB family RNase H-like nuclease
VITLSGYYSGVTLHVRADILSDMATRTTTTGPPDEPQVTLNVRMPASLYDRLRVHARAEDRSMNSLVRTAVRRLLDNADA